MTLCAADAVRRQGPSGPVRLPGDGGGQDVAALAESEIGPGYDQSPIVAEIGTPPTSSSRATKIGYRGANVADLIGRADGAPYRTSSAWMPLSSSFWAAPTAELIAALPALRAAADAGRGGVSFYPVVHAMCRQRRCPGKFCSTRMGGFRAAGCRPAAPVRDTTRRTSRLFLRAAVCATRLRLISRGCFGHRELQFSICARPSHGSGW